MTGGLYVLCWNDVEGQVGCVLCWNDVEGQMCWNDVDGQVDCMCCVGMMWRDRWTVCVVLE